MSSNAFLEAERILFVTALVAYFASMILYFVFFALKKEKMAKTAGIVLTCAFAVHTVMMIVRGIGAGRVPLTNQYEFANAFGWGIAFVLIIFVWKYKFAALGTFATPVVFFIIGYAAMQNREVDGLPAVLRSKWLIFHVSTAIISYGAFGVSFAVALIFLLREKKAGSEFWEKHVPQLPKLDMISYRSVSLGLLFLTFTIITGAIWAEYSWGSYWSWDPKETWSLVTWLIYSLYLHLRIRRGWKGKSAAIFAAIGFICVIFTYIGVNTIMPGLHSYA